MTFYLILAVAAVIIGSVITLRRWLASARPNLDRLLAMPWWQRPVARLAILMLKREVWRDAHEAAGFVKTVNNRKRCTLAAWRAIAVSRHEGRWRIRVRVKRGFTQGNEETDTDRNAKQTVLDQVAGTFGLGEYDYQWHFWFAFSHVVITPKQVIPSVARFRNPDYRNLIETALRARPTAPIIAIGRGDQPIAFDLDESADASHVLINAGTGGGKSVTVRNIVTQLLWADPDAIAVICDAKEQSQRGLSYVPGVMVARSGGEINGAMIAVLAEIRRRNAICRDIPLGQPMPKFPRIILGLEEMNDTEKVLKDWWRSEGGGTSRDLPPSLRGLSSILCTGRQARVNVVLVAQQANVKTTGGGEGRANVAVRIMAEYGPREWEMLAHGADYIPSLPHKGWCVVVHGRNVQEGQRIMMTDEQAHAWLTGTGTNGDRAKVLAETFPDGIIDTTAIDAPQTTNPTPDAGSAGALDPDGTSAGAEGAHGPSPSVLFLPGASDVSMVAIGAGNGAGTNDGEDVYATLRDMFEDDEEVRRLIPSLPALRKAAQDPRFPAEVPMPGGYEYSRKAVKEFLAGRASRRRSRPKRGWVYVLVFGGQARLRQLELTGNRDEVGKIGYTSRDPRVRAKELSPYRPEDIVKLVEVDHPPEGVELPDRGYHRRFGDRDLLVHLHDPTSEMRYIRGEFAAWLDVRFVEVSA